jgi:SsrA-binding protein
MKKVHVADNRKASFDVQIEQTYEAGLSLTGDEIKSIRAKRAQLSGSYVKFLSGKPVVIGLHLSLAKEPERVRNMLLHKKEISEIDQLLSAKGKVAVPLDLYLKGGWAKISVGVGVGRKRFDKRELIKRRDLDRATQGEFKRRK